MLFGDFSSFCIEIYYKRVEVALKKKLLHNRGFNSKSYSGEKRKTFFFWSTN